MDLRTAPTALAHVSGRRFLSHTPRQCGFMRAWLNSYLQSNLLKDSHSIEPWRSLLNLGIAFHFLGFDALQLRIVNASVLLRLIVDAGRRRRREVGFPPGPAQGKTRRQVFGVAATTPGCRAGSFRGQREKISRVGLG
jgi:hypothetical protein